MWALRPVFRILAGKEFLTLSPDPIISPENGLRFVVRVRFGVGRAGSRIGPGCAGLGLFLAALKILTQLCGQSLLTLLRLFGFTHRPFARRFHRDG